MARVTAVLEDTARSVHTSRVRAVRQAGVFPARHLHVAIVRGGDDQVVVQAALTSHHAVTRLLPSLSQSALTFSLQTGNSALMLERQLPSSLQTSLLLVECLS